MNTDQLIALLEFMALVPLCLLAGWGLAVWWEGLPL
jgi:hypothetical protein